MQYTSFLVLLNFFLAAHIHAQRFRNINGTVLVNIVFKESDKHTWWCNYGIVQRMGKVFSLFLAADTDAQTTSLRIAQIGAAATSKYFC